MMRKSVHAPCLSKVVVDLLMLMRGFFELPDAFKNADPQVGEGWIMLSPQSLSHDIEAKTVGPLNCQFIASRAFDSYQAGFMWATETAMNLSAIAPQLAANIDTQCLLLDVVVASDIMTGTPRTPIKRQGGSVADTWIMTVSCTLALKLSVQMDLSTGHL